MYITDITIDNITAEVMDASNQALILVDFWAPWCGPCKTLMPTLEKLTHEYQGAFRLAKINIDEQPQLAQQFGVRSVPTVKLVRSGQLVDEFTGAIAESEIRALLERHIVRESDNLMTEALQRYQLGQASAVDDMKQIINNDPSNNNIRLQFVDVLANEKQFDDALQILQALPAEIRDSETVRARLSRLEVMSMADAFGDLDTLQARVAQHPDDCEARQQLSNACLANGDFETALEQLFEIMKRDRQYNEDAGRTGMLKVFEMLGNSGELVSRYRKRMASLLY